MVKNETQSEFDNTKDKTNNRMGYYKRERSSLCLKLQKKNSFFFLEIKLVLRRNGSRSNTL
jgi:hypothetical protein